MSKKSKKSSSYNVDPRSTRKTFDAWLSECCSPHISVFTGVLSIDGSDGIDVTNGRVGKARFEEPDHVDKVLEEEGYYGEADGFIEHLDWSGSWILGDDEPEVVKIKAPTKRYGEWFKEKYK